MAVTASSYTSAIPFLFPSSVLWVDGRREFFGDGSMRQVSPLSPAMHLGAHKILVVGVGQPERSGFVGGTGNGATQPTMGGIAGHAMVSVFRDTLQQLPREVAAVMPCAAWRCWRSSQRSRLTHWPHELPVSVRRAQGGQDAYARKEELLAFLNGSTA